MKKHRVAFVGFRHPHIFSLWERTQQHPHCEVVAACETDPASREQLRVGGKVELTHSDFQQMLKESSPSVVAIGDVYARRGALAIAALRANRHVISDKPLCTSLDELEEITALAREGNLSVGCQLDLVEMPSLRRLRGVIQSGELGRLCTVTIGAQHPLRTKLRAAWYFEPGQHGGTINDIGVHIFDLVPWLSGQRWEKLFGAREWNAKASTFPHFKDCAQFHGALTDGLSCFADVSYLAPDQLGYELPHYWRITVHGVRGMAEICYGQPEVRIVTDDDASPRVLSVPLTPTGGYLEDFLGEIEGTSTSRGMSTDRVLSATRWALTAQYQARQ